MASSRMIALLGLLAVAGYQNRDKLGDFFGRLGNGNQGDPGTNPPGMRPANDEQQGGLGGLLGGLGSMFGGDKDAAPGQSTGGIGGFLGNLFGSSPGQGLRGGLNDLIDRFNGTDGGDVARSWVESGPNRQIADVTLEQALGEDTIETLTRQTGLSRQELLARLSATLPDAIDKLTPEGRLPTEAEVERLAGARA